MKRHASASVYFCCFVGVALYGVMNYLSGIHFLPGCSFAELRPQVCIPMFLGLYFGPLAGFVTGAAGDSLGYVLAAKNPIPLWYWALANGLMGLIPGLAGGPGARVVTNLRAMQKVYFLLILAALLPFLFSSGMEVLYGHLPLKAAFFQLFLPIFITDALFAVILIPFFMLLFGLLKPSIPTGTFLLSTYLTSLAVLGTYAAAMVTVWGRNALSSVAANDLYVIGIMALLVIVIGFIAASFFIKRLTAPIIHLTQVSDQVAAGDYQAITGLDSLCTRPDELGQLASAFQCMAAKVHERERLLQSQVQELHIEINKVKQQKEVARITGTDYFKTLKSKASQLRLENE
ncbi:MAG: ECF transporter S component [Kiritimatiellae bacterium]|nr:ECF transporter S component [Kiritimatiellia bacterium]